jgi:hypothetical protein
MPKDEIGNREVKDRFEPDANPCEVCKWMYKVSASEFPCLYCIHNENHAR